MSTSLTVDQSIVGSVLALCTQTPGAFHGDGPTHWHDELRQLKRSGFDRVDLLDNWLPIADLTASDLERLGSILAELGLTAPCLGTSRRSVIDPARGRENLDYTLRIIDAAAALGLRRVGMGFHPALVDAQRRSLPFWGARRGVGGSGDGNWELAAERVRVICDAAAGSGIDVNIEMYEDSLLCTADDATRLITAVGRPNLGVNPDLGNLIRSSTPMREPWLTTLRGCLPHMNYWHLKNYTVHPDTRRPVRGRSHVLGEGTIDYRLAVQEAIRAGYAGPFVVEHYGGDALWMQEQGRKYLQKLLAELVDDEKEMP